MALQADGGKFNNARVWLGGVAPTPYHADEVEQLLLGVIEDSDEVDLAEDALNEEVILVLLQPSRVFVNFLEHR